MALIIESCIRVREREEGDFGISSGIRTSVITATRRLQLQGCVFVVDDEPAVAWTLVEILRIHGLKAFSFANPNDAADAACTDEPRLLISDLVMPGLSGIELAIGVIKMWPQCKVLLRSGEAQSEDLLTTARDGGHDFDFLLKPAHPTVLLSRINSLMRREGED